MTALWSGARSRWPDLITEWNSRGLRWREWGWVEMVWMLHHRNIQRIAEGQKSQMRKYLQGAGDIEYLRVWDLSQMSDKFSDKNDQ